MAFASDVRNACQYWICEERREALSPYSISRNNDRLCTLLETGGGSASHYSPAAAQLETAWVPTILSGQETDAEACLYGESG